jgi:hypothetical protein
MKKILFSILAISVLIACDKDDPAEVAPQTTNPQLILGARATSEVTEMTVEPGDYTLDVDFGFAAVGGTTYYGSDVNFTFEGEEYFLDVEPDGDNYVNVGDYQYPFTVDPPSGDVPFQGIIQDINIDVSDLDYSYEVIDRPNDLVVLRGQSTPLVVHTVLYGNIPSVNPDQLQFVMDWQDPSGNDLDCRIQSPTNISYDTSYSVSRYENVEINNADDDGTYYLTIRVWTGSGTVPVKFFVRYPDETLEILDYDLTITGTFWAQEELIFEIEKSGSDYTVTMI